jgi:hypothetical protein
MFKRVSQKLRSVVEIDVVNWRGEVGGDGDFFPYSRPALRVGVAVRDALGEGIDYTDFDVRFPTTAARLLLAAVTLATRFSK